jgi:hypothetical protein
MRGSVEPGSLKFAVGRERGNPVFLGLLQNAQRNDLKTQIAENNLKQSGKCGSYAEIIVKNAQSFNGGLHVNI